MSEAVEVQRIIRAAVSKALLSPWVDADQMRLAVILTAATADVLIAVAYSAGRENDPKFRDEYAEKCAGIMRQEISRAWADHDRVQAGGRR